MMQLKKLFDYKFFIFFALAFLFLPLPYSYGICTTTLEERVTPYDFQDDCPSELKLFFGWHFILAALYNLFNLVFTGRNYYLILGYFEVYKIPYFYILFWILGSFASALAARALEHYISNKNKLKGQL